MSTTPTGDVSAVSRRFAASLLAAASFHVLLGLAVFMPAHPLARHATQANVEVDLVEARPDPVREAPSRSVNDPSSSASRAAERALARPSPKPRLRARREREVVAVPPSATVTPSGVDLQAAIRPQVAISVGGAVPSAPRVTTRSGAAPAAITVLATPRYRSNPTPDYPLSSRRKHEEGVVLLTVGVGTDGRTSDVALKRSCGYPALDLAAIDSVRGWTFEPARAAGVPVSSHVIVPVRFSLAQR